MEIQRLPSGEIFQHFLALLRFSLSRVYVSFSSIYFSLCRFLFHTPNCLFITLYDLSARINLRLTRIFSLLQPNTHVADSLMC